MSEERLLIKYDAESGNNMWFGKKDDFQTLKNHLGKTTPDSIKKEAQQELERRGYPREWIDKEIYDKS